MRMDFPLLEGKRGLVVGIANHDSIATGCARSFKAALEASVRYLAAELGPRDIRVNALSPGPLKTRAASGIAHFDSLIDEARERAPQHRLVSIDDVGNMAMGLISDAACNVTGKVRRPRVLLPEVHLHERGARFNELMAACASLAPITVAVVHPCDELMSAVIRKDTGIRTERRMSHVYALDVPHYSKLLYITDAAINIYPTLADKRDIIQNAIELLHALGHDQPAVAILSAVETINPAISSTLDAAALCKMAQRGQITGARLEGPLAFDNAISAAAAAEKGIVSDVAGHADILVAPDLEAANMMAKQLIYLAGAEAAGVVLGARVPIILTSRADTVLARMVSCAMVQIQSHHLLQQNT